MSDNFQKIGLIGKYADSKKGEHLQSIADHLLAQGRELYLDQSTAEVLSLDGVNALTRDEIGEQCDLAIVVGGDGTLLNAARSLARHEVPLVGINMGRLGFLTDISLNEYAAKLDEILSGEYQMEERLLLQVKVIRDGAVISESIAFNDVVVHKWEEARMLEFETCIDGGFVNSQRSDGLIIATPTGSTAYALSGGGPIIHPNLQATVLVPICPHTLSLRPLVVDGKSTVEITISEGGHGRAQVTCDGQINLGVIAADKIQVTRHPQPVKLLHPRDYHYFEILRAKLHWGERLT